MSEKNKVFENIYDDIKKNENNIVNINVDYDYLFNHEISKQADLTLDEVKQNAFLIKDIIDEIDQCKLSNSDNCNNVIGYHRYIVKDNNRITIVARECPKRLAFKDKYSYKANFLYDSFANQDISKVLINKEYFKTAVDQSVKDIVSNYNSMVKNNEIKGMYIYGDFGIGKTYLSMAMANDLSKKTNKKVMFVYITDFVSKIKQGFNNYYIQEINNSLIEDMKKVDYLFLDDIGSEYAAEWFYNDYLLNILNERLLANKATFFNSNLSLNDLEKHIQLKIKNVDNSKIVVGRLMDRIRSLVGNKSILMKGKNRRY